MFSVAFAIVNNEQANTLGQLGPLFLRVVSFLIPLGGVVLFIMIVLGGFSFMTAGGDPRKAEGAKATITYAIGGIVVLALAFFIIQLIANFVGVRGILDFQIYQGAAPIPEGGTSGGPVPN